MNKEEFIKKFHTTKTLTFEPPTFEEFMATGTDGRYPHWYCGDFSIIMREENHLKGILHDRNVIYVYDDRGDCDILPFIYVNDKFVDTREETYYKALECMKNLFLE